MDEEAANRAICEFLDRELNPHGLKRWYHGDFDYGVMARMHFVDKVEKVTRGFWRIRWKATKQTTVARILSEPHAPDLLISGDLKVMMLVDDDEVRKTLQAALRSYESRFGLKATLIS